MSQVQREEEMYKIWDLERMLGVSRATVYRWCKDGTVNFIKLPSGHIRIPYKEVEKLKCYTK